MDAILGVLYVNNMRIC